MGLNSSFICNIILIIPSENNKNGSKKTILLLRKYQNFQSRTDVNLIFKSILNFNLSVKFMGLNITSRKYMHTDDQNTVTNS